MKCSVKSWHAKLYRLSYGEYEGLPNNLCPYFWSIVEASISFVPLSILYAPMALINFIVIKFSKDKDQNVFENGYFSYIFFLSLVINTAIFVAFSMVYMWFQKVRFDGKQYKFTVFQIAGTVGYLILIGVGIHFLVQYIKEKKRNAVKTANPHILSYKEPEPNLLVEFVKAKYKKYCPKIDWSITTTPDSTTGEDKIN